MVLLGRLGLGVRFRYRVRVMVRVSINIRLLVLYFMHLYSVDGAIESQCRVSSADQII